MIAGDHLADRMAAALIKHIESPSTNATPSILADMREDAMRVTHEGDRARILSILEIAEQHFREKDQ